MKKTKLLIALVLGIAIGMLISVGIYFLTIGDIAWQEYLETKLIPNAVLALSTISALCVAAMPLLSKIKTTLKGFDKATEDVNTTAENGKNTVSNVLECRDEIKLLVEDLKTVKQDIETAIAPIKKNTENLEKIVRIGFGNTSELVKNGYARQIAKVGNEDEEA